MEKSDASVAKRSSHAKTLHCVSVLLGVVAISSPLYAAHSTELQPNPRNVSAHVHDQLTHARNLKQDSSPSSNPLSAVVITGLRQSLLKSMLIKENANQVVNAISAQAIGQFPDSDVAAALSRLPGVAVDNDGTGAANQVTVRGFGPQFNTVLVNGQTLPTQTGGTLFDFDSLPSDFIRRAEVFETSEAWQPAGSIGGLIELRTWQPFDFKGPRLIAKLSSNMNTQGTAKVEPSGFLLLSNTFDHRKFGALFAVGAQEQATTTYDIGAEGGYNTVALNGPGEPTGVWQNPTQAGKPSSILLPNTTDVERNYYNVKRLNMNAAFQWRITRHITATLDGLYNKYTEEALSTQLGLFVTGNPINNGAIVRPDGVYQQFTVHTHSDLINSTSYDQVTPQYLRSIRLKVNGKAFGSLLWDVDASDATNSASNYTNPSLYTVAGFPILATYINNNGTGIPNVSTTANLINTSLPRAHYTSVAATNDYNKITQLASNDSWFPKSSWSPLTEIRFGAFWQRNEFRSFGSANSGDVCAYCGYGASIPSTLFSITSVPTSFVSPYAGTFPSTFLTYNANQELAFLDSSTAFAENDAAFGLAPGTTQAQVQAANGFVPQTQGEAPQDLSTVTETSLAAYVQGDFHAHIFGFSLGGNVGVRFVHTGDSSVGYGQVLQNISPNPFDPTKDEVTYKDNGQALFKQKNNSYNYVLPSVNVRLNLPHKVVLRVAASKSLARPAPSYLSPVINYGGALVVPTALDATGGNPALRPYTSMNYDFGVEWYYSHSGFVAADGFIKNLSNFIEYEETTLAVPIQNTANSSAFPNNVATFNFTRPTNIGTANVKGVELSGQYMFSHLPAPFNGLGVNANATILSTNAGVNASGTAATGANQFGLTGLGDYQNFTLIYQKYGVGIRVTYSHRGRYIYQIGDGINPLAPVYVRGYSELDAQVSYRVTPHVIVSLSGANMTNAAQQMYDTRTDEFYNFVTYGPRYELSVRAEY